MKNLHLLSDEELMFLYKKPRAAKKLILAELENRGFVLQGKIFSTRIIKTAKNIEVFLRDCGFEDIWKHVSGIMGEYIKEKTGDELYCYQINGEGISKIESLDAPAIFCINGKDPSVTPMYSYSKEYPNLKALVTGESHRNIFKNGLKNWQLQ